MDLLRIGFTHAPNQTKKTLTKIYSDDAKNFKTPKKLNLNLMIKLETLKSHLLSLNFLEITMALKNAIKLVRAAARCKVDAIKIQTYTADTMTLNSKKKGFVINNKSSIWHGYKLYNLYKKAHTPWSWHKKIFQEAKKHNLICFSSPFDETAINFLKFNPLPIYKIASFENTDLRLIKLAAKTKKF